jgi:hypothetical protein
LPQGLCNDLICQGVSRCPILPYDQGLTKLRAMTCNKPQAASEIVAAIEQSLPPDPRLGDLVDALGEQAGGILLVAIAIPAIIPAPGIPSGRSLARFW